MIKNHFHFRPLDCQGPGWAYGRTGPAIRAFIVVAPDFPGGILDMHPLGFEIVHPILEIFTGTG